MKILKSIILSIFIAVYPLFSAYSISFFTHQNPTFSTVILALTSLLVIYFSTDILFKILSNNKSDYIKGITFIFIVGFFTSYNKIAEDKWNQYESFLLVSYLIEVSAMFVGYKKK